MLICRRGEWQVESDGYVSSEELYGLDGLREMEASIERDVEYEIAQLADRVRALKRRAWRRGYEGGRRAALHHFAALPAAVSFATQRLQARLADMAVNTITSMLGELPPEVVLRARLRQCLDASCEQQLLSVRVSTDDYEATQRSVRALEHELNAPALTVLPDAGPPPNSLVVETESGVIDGSLTTQLRVLEQGVRDAIRELLDEYRYLDDESAKQFDTVADELQHVIDGLGVPDEAHGDENGNGDEGSGQ
ncbi:MAG TPA: flagellar biosynthesis protein [Paraburkholderia sp.]|jgi:type III secretion protein L|nr:flagellar biosynthesis protein [Paraburkholderia sp.]